MVDSINSSNSAGVAANRAAKTTAQPTADTSGSVANASEPSASVEVTLSS